MAKRKVDLGFTPSPYQEKIFDWIQHGVGNAVVSALAGSGKTTSAIAALKFIPKKEKCLFVAFNKSIADELKVRLEKMKNVRVRTAHSLGYLMLRREFGEEIEIDEYKYKTYVRKNLADLSLIDGTMGFSQHQITTYIDAIVSLIDLARFNLAQSSREIKQVAEKYDIPIIFDECEVVAKCLKWGVNYSKSIDFTDMVWMPVELSLPTFGLQYDWVFGDEAQDFSPVQYQLIKKCFKGSTRSVFIGDENQSIYAFCGADENSFNVIKSQPNTTVFELPITYRCSKNVVKIANELVPALLPREDAPDGVVINECRTNVLKDGDMVLARTKSPLMTLYTKLIKKKINCYIKGQDIGRNLINLVQGYKYNDLYADLSQDGLFVRMYDTLFNERNKLMTKYGLDYRDATLSTQIMERYDTINALIIMSEKCKNKNDLIKRIEKTFSETGSGICLSTIHKSKGLEANNVYVLCKSGMPSKLAHHDWEIQQEQNLIYVAYTRAKETLGFISEKEIKPNGCIQDPLDILNDLSYIENKVCKILNKTPIEKLDDADFARFKLKTATKVEGLHDNDNMKVAEDIQSITVDDNLLAELESL